MRSGKKQDLLSKLGAWGPWGSIERRKGEVGRGAEKNVELNKYQLKNWKKTNIAICILNFSLF